MNLIAIDIGNTNITFGLYLKDQLEKIETISGDRKEELQKGLTELWEIIPVSKSSKEKKRDGVIVVSSVKPVWTEMIAEMAKEKLDEKILMVGKEIPFPIDLSIKENSKIGTDRVLAAAAAYSVVEQAVVVADFGTAVTIDLVDDRGIFLGGTILPGFEIAAKALNEHTALLPKVEVTKPELPFGQTTSEAINCGLYYSAVGALQEIIRLYAEKIGTWPQTVITGSGAKIILDDCKFIDSYVPNLVIQGIAPAYRNYINSKE